MRSQMKVKIVEQETIFYFTENNYAKVILKQNILFLVTCFSAAAAAAAAVRSLLRSNKIENININSRYMLADAKVTMPLFLK